MFELRVGKYLFHIFGDIMLVLKILTCYHFPFNPRLADSETTKVASFCRQLKIPHEDGAVRVRNRPLSTQNIDWYPSVLFTDDTSRV